MAAIFDFFAGNPALLMLMILTALAVGIALPIAFGGESPHYPGEISDDELR